MLDWNEPAINFYRGLGAVPMGEETTYRLTGEALRSLAGQAHAGSHPNGGALARPEQAGTC